MRQLDGRVAVVTGAGSGIGRATAVRLAERGCRLGLGVVDVAGVEATRSMIDPGGATATVHIADVADRDRMTALADEVVTAHGSCHILINNAGVTSAGRFADEAPEDVAWIVGINVFGVLHGCHAFLPVLREAEEAHIVNLSSMVAFVGLPQNAVYSLTKGAVRSFTESLRAELIGTSIGVTAVFPGAIHTNIMQTARGAEADRLATMARSRFAPMLLRPPEAVARKIVTAIEKDRARTLVGPDARVLDLVARIAPGRSGLVGRVLDLVS
jgi:short-subunit dehydrogenase